MNKQFWFVSLLDADHVIPCPRICLCLSIFSMLERFWALNTHAYEHMRTHTLATTRRHNTNQHKSTQINTPKDNTTRHVTTQHNTIQHNTTHNNTTQYLQVLTLVKHRRERGDHPKITTHLPIQTLLIVWHCWVTCCLPHHFWSWPSANSFVDASICVCVPSGPWSGNPMSAHLSVPIHIHYAWMVWNFEHKHTHIHMCAHTLANTRRHSTTQHDTTQHSRTQHNTT